MQTWLCKLRYIFKNIYKKVFLNRYIRLDEIEDYNNFFKIIEKFKQVIVKFNKNDIIRSKVNLFNYVIKRKDF